MTVAAQTGPRAPERRGRVWEDALKIALYAALIAFAVRTVIVQPFHIPSDSMRPAVLEGDYVLVSKWAYGWSRHSVPLAPEILGEGRLFARAPRRGEIVVFHGPNSGRQAYIKRVVGLPGDTVRMADGALILNGEPIGRRAVRNAAAEADRDAPLGYETVIETLPGGVSYSTYERGPGNLDDTEEFQVPDGHYFMLGDNRDASIDSRVGPPLGPGLVPEANLVGRAELVLVSAESDFAIHKPWTWARLRPGRFFADLEARP